MSSASTPLRVAVTGATGFLGSALTRELRGAGHTVVPITRRRDAAGPDAILWGPQRDELHPRALEGVDALVHLAGENLAQRWSDRVKREIRESRVRSTALLARTITSMERPPRVWLSGSAIGIYGDRGTELLDESSTLGRGFLAETAAAWEAATAASARADVRIVLLRTGLALAAHGGALQKMLPPFRLGLGGKIGSGTQIVSWIELTDWARAVMHLLHAPHAAGPVNLTAPNPVSNAELTSAIGEALGRPTVVSVPAAAIRITLGEMGEATLLGSQRVVPTRLLGTGFSFSFPTIGEAMTRALGVRP